MKQKIGFITLCILFLTLNCIAVNGEEIDINDVEKYAPCFYFEQEESCYPIDVQYTIDNAELKTKILADENVTYYDNIRGTVDDDGVINDYKNKMNQYQTIIYYHIDTDPVSGSEYIQYWMFYAFNKGEDNQHEGDWEMVEVVIPSTGEKWVAYSQHYSGQQATWDQVEKDGDHIKVYVSRGSHANYLRSYSGRLGIAHDIVGDNGKVITSDDYTLVALDNQSWLHDNILWGEVESEEDFILGRAGPQGPKYRQDMNGNFMWQGVIWGENLFQANSILFFIELLLSHFFTIFIIITILSLSIVSYKIFKRHKKESLGPRIVSLFYIDGLNLHSIGNILCIIGIIVAIIGLMNQWYYVSGDINVADYNTSGMVEIISVDGLNGVQITLPGLNGPIPMGTVIFPFSFIILISFIFMILATIGIRQSKKLGGKYLYRGIRLIILVFVLIISIVTVGMFSSPGGTTGFEGGDYVSDLLNSISSSPLGGEHAFTISEQSITGTVEMKWGLGLGSILIFFSGLLIIISGILEKTANHVFFSDKTTSTEIKKQKIASKKEKKEE